MVPEVASARSAEEDAANTLYTEGKRAFEEGRHGAALGLFQKAYEVLQNDFIRYYLGRTHAALGQCESALDYFGELKRTLPPAPREERRKVEVSCRLDLATSGLDSYRCHEALETIKPIATRLRSPEHRRRFSALQATAQKCTDVFGTRTSLGQKAARYYAEARAALRAGRTSKALMLADKSLASKASRPAAAVEAIALAKLGRCRVAIGRLDAAIPHANGEDGHIMGELSLRCRMSEAKRLLKGGTCYEIIRMLEPLEGKLSKADDLWRRQKINWCRPHAAPFPTDSAPNKAAYGLFKAAREAREGAEPQASTRANGLYEKALKLSEQPLIRSELSRVQVVAQGCDASLKTLSKLPEEARRAEDRALMEICTRYPPAPPLSGAALGRHVEALMEVLSLRDAGVYLQAISRLDLIETRVSPALRALRADLLYGAGRCDDYVADVEKLSASERARVVEASTRLAECRPPTPEAQNEGQATTTGLSKEEPTPPVAPALHDTRGTSALGHGLAPWLTLGAGAALSVAGIALGVVWFDDKGRYDAAQSSYESGTGDEALAALQTMEELSGRAELSSGLAIGLGAAGAVALGVGLYLLLSDDPASWNTEGPVLSLYPSVSPSHVGIGGTF